MKWRYFTGACLLGGYVMLSMGAPLAAVIAGALLAAAWNAFKRRANSRAVNL